MRILGMTDRFELIESTEIPKSALHLGLALVAKPTNVEVTQSPAHFFITAQICIRMLSCLLVARVHV